MVKHIGIVACSAEGAALCYRTICTEGADFMGRYAHPEVTMHTYPLSEYMKYIEADNWEDVASLMLASVNKLADVGADFAICPDNTIHEVFNIVIEKSPIPWLHIAEEVAKEVKRQKYKCLGILGTRYLMEGPVYSDTLTKMGINFKIPEKVDRERINDIIFIELVNGKFYEKSRAYFEEVIGKLKNEDCDAVVLGCTEIPLIVIPETSPLPTLDSTRLLARAALRKAIGK
ncbi:amino acid racemase [Candidatus Borrarchaeum sp.]|uniref:aspartate/glutamate racemase family protein n=1 Tax=Candidatus Borrarchaeum sp. TaxID=2846742 RepID=UPI00257FE255|nr:amino acid racemase [Candidatus Borrarchaeum sp.]